MEVHKYVVPHVFNRLRRIDMTRLLYTLVIVMFGVSCSPDSDVVLSDWELLDGPSDHLIGDIIEIQEQLFVACYDGYFKSYDMGETWVEITTLPEVVSVPYSGLRRLANWGDTLFAKINQVNGSTFQKSFDLGQTWQPAFNGTVFWGADIPVFLDEKIFLGVFSSQGPRTMRSEDYGASWSFVGVDERLFSMVSIGGIYISPVEGGFARSSDGGATFSINYIDGLIFSPKKIAVHQNVAFSGTYGAGLFSVHKSYDSGLTWVACGIDEYTIGASESISESNRVLIPANGRVYYTTDFGESWQLFGGELPGRPSTFFRFIKGSSYYFLSAGQEKLYRKLID